jgi:hypothetical protein
LLSLPSTQKRLRRSGFQAGGLRFPVLGDQVPRDELDQVPRLGRFPGLGDQVLRMRKLVSLAEKIRFPG